MKREGASGNGRTDRLRRRLDAFLHDTAERRLRDAEEQRAAATIAAAVYRHTHEPVESLRRAAFLEAFAETMPIRLDADEIVVGSQLFSVFRPARPADLPAGAPWFEGNGGHVVVDYGRVLSLGIPGLHREIAAMPGDTLRQRQNRQAFRRALDAFARFIRRHADGADAAGMTEVAAICAHLAGKPPATFPQALQLTWFTHVFLHAESSAVAISFGRLDQYLWPYLERDLDEGLLDRPRAREWLACFWLKCCEGDESQNLVLGGCDSNGRKAENPLSILCLQLARELRLWQPSVGVRITPQTSERFWREALNLCAAGFGMPSFFHDAVVIDSLRAAGIPLERARDWAVVGCYEATPQGDCLARTVHGQWILPQVFLTYLGELTERHADPTPSTFAAFRDGLKTLMAREYAHRKADFQTRWNTMRDTQASPFRSLCMTGCCASGLCAEEGGTRFNLFGVNVLGLGTLVDSLWAVQRLVYETGEVTLDELARRLRDNVADEGWLRHCRTLPGKYGSGNPATDELAAEFAHLVADLVLGSPLEHGVQPYPGLFIFTGWAHMDIPATPDGRRHGEPVSYGIGPSVYCAGRTPTSALLSAARAANDRCGCGNPMLLTLNRADMTGDERLERLRHTIETYFRAGGSHLHMNILDATQLRQAQDAPRDHADLLVRISGLSAQFVALDKRLQDALIARVEQGL
ncbi:MAG: hypothetical protein JXR77_12280 [Lentisphaeria bacterium]|nr:hypothetical protein [Lentisphaeria bacterium]